MIRQGSPSIVSATAVECGAPSPSAIASATVSMSCSSGVEISTSSPRTVLVAPAAAAIIWFIASATAERSISSSGSPLSDGLGAHHRGGELLARR